MKGLWNHLVLESYCENEDCPHEISPTCLKEGCKSLLWCEATERDAAFFVPLHLILWDKLWALLSNIYWWGNYYLYFRWRKRKDLPSES